MTRNAAWLAMFVAIAATSAGCADKSAPTGANGQAPRVQFDDATGAIDGKILDDGLLPVPEALVRLDGRDETRSDANGSFAFSKVAPGPHRIAVAHQAYEAAAVDIEVVAGQVVDVDVVLRELPSTRPYRETLIQSGQLDCYASFSVAFGEISEELPCHANTLPPTNYVPLTHLLGSLSNVTGLWSETTWSSTQATGKGMWVTWYIEYGDLVLGVQLLGQSWGENPVTFIISGDELRTLAEERNAAPCTVDECHVVARHKPYSMTLGNEVADVGWMFQQRFDEYVTLFHNEPLPESFSALPDS